MDRATYGYFVDWNGNGLFNHAQSDISAYVLTSSWQAGSDSPVPGQTRAGAARLLLDNSSSIFSPSNSSSPIFGLVWPGLRVKITMKIGAGAPVTMWAGYLEMVDPVVGEVAGVSTAELTAYGILGQSTSARVNLAMQEDITTGAAMAELLDEAGIGSGDRQLDAGQSTLSRFWARNKDLLAVLRELEAAECGLLREGKDGKLVFEDRAHRLSAPHTVVQATYGAGSLEIWKPRQLNSLPGIFNQIEAKVRTFNVSEETTLATIADVARGIGGTPPSIPGSGNLTIWIEVPTPNSPSEYLAVHEWGMVDYEVNTEPDGSGSDITTDVTPSRTEYGDRIRLDFQNNNPLAGHFVVLRAHGAAVVEGDSLPVTAEDAASQGKCRTRSFPIPSQWLTDLEEARAYCEHIIACYKDPRTRLTFELRANYDAAHLGEAQRLDVSDRIHVTAGAPFGLYVDEDLFVEHLLHSVDHGGVHRVQITCAPPLAYQWGPSGQSRIPNTVGENRRATGGKSIVGQGNATGDPTLTELFVQDERNPTLYHRMIKVEFTPPPTDYNSIFPRRAQISTPQVLTTGGSIAGGQSIVVEVCSQADGMDGLASLPLLFTIPAGTQTNKITFLCRLPAEATHYVIRVGPHVGRTYRLGNAIASPGTDWFTITLTDISALNSASLSPDPRFHHVRVYYFYDGSPGVIRDAGRTLGPTDNEFVFQPEVSGADDAKITVVLSSANAAETDLYPFDYSPRAELTLTKDTGNPSGASDLEILTGADDINIPSGYVAFQFNRETVNHTSISGVAVVLSKSLPAHGPYAAERAAYPGQIVETGICTIRPGSLAVEVIREANPAAVGRVLLIYTDDESPDSDLSGEIITSEAENALYVLTPFSKGGTYSYAIVQRWWDTATPGETSNCWYHWFPIDHSRVSLFGLGPVNLAAWRTPPRLAPSGTFYATAYARNIFGVGTRLIAGPKAMSHVADDLLANAIPNGPTILFGVEARKHSAGVCQAEFRAKFFAPGTAGQFADLRTPEEGGTLVDDGETQLVRGGLFAAYFGAQYTHVTDDQGRWFFAWRLKNPGGWSTWSDGNDVPLYVKHYVDTEDESKVIGGPAADWTVSVAAGPQPNTVVVTATRPAVNGGRIWEWAVQIKDATTGAWRILDANAGASVVKYDGSAISHSLTLNGSCITRDSGSGFGSAAVGDLILFDVRGGQFGVKYCQWGTVTFVGSNYVNVQGHFRPVGTSDFRITIVRPPWEWDNDGYLGSSGYWNQVFWDQPNVPGDVTTQLFYTSVPLPIPEGLEVEDVQARVWFDNGYSRSDDDKYSEGGSGSFAYGAHSSLTDLDFESSGHTGFVAAAREVNTVGPLTGGGDLSDDLTLEFDPELLPHGVLADLEEDDHEQYLPRSGVRAMTGAFKPAVVALIDAATIATDASLGSHFRVTIAGDRTLGVPTGATDGQRCIWEFKQDPTGNRKLTLSSAFDKGVDFDITLSTAANKVDLMGAVYNAGAGKWFITGFIKGYG